MTNPEPRGVGGWLLLFCFGQVLFAPPRAFQSILQVWERIGPHPFPVVRKIADILAIIILAITAYGMIVGILIWRRNRHGRALARQYLIVRIGVSALVFGSLTAWGYNTLGISAAKRMALATITPCAMEIGVCLLWFAYFTYSKRVRNTYCIETQSEAGKEDQP
jgi:Protein of unknown function (DUF2569)